MRVPTLFLSLLTLLLSSGAATNLVVSSYDGQITTLSLDNSSSGYELKTLALTAAPLNTTWLTIDKDHSILYAIDEGIASENGSVTSFRVSADHSLVRLAHVDTIGGPVHGAIYGNSNGSQALALAHYGPYGALSTFAIEKNGGLTPLQNFTFAPSKPASATTNQTQPHPHQVIVDPTGRYILVLDLGADLVRVFGFDTNSTTLAEHMPLSVKVGSGPRHAAFFSAGCGRDAMSVRGSTSPTYQPGPSHAVKNVHRHMHQYLHGNSSTRTGHSLSTYMYLVSESSSTVTAYEVSYPVAGGLTFREISSSSTLGAYNSSANGIPKAAEVAIVPGRYTPHLLVSTRNDSSFQIPQQDFRGQNVVSNVSSDSLSSFQISPADGSLSFVALAPADGSFPRTMAVNRAGALVAVGLQNSQRVVVLAFDKDTGRIGLTPLAEVNISGQVTNVIWED